MAIFADTCIYIDSWVDPRMRLATICSYPLSFKTPDDFFKFMRLMTFLKIIIASYMGLNIDSIMMRVRDDNLDIG